MHSLLIQAEFEGPQYSSFHLCCQPHTHPYSPPTYRQGFQGISHSPALAVAPVCPNLPPKHISWLLTQVTSLPGPKILQTQLPRCSCSSASRSHLMPAKQSSVAKEKDAITLLRRYLYYFYRPALPFLQHWNIFTSGWDKHPIQYKLLCLLFSSSAVLLLGHL